MNQTTNYREKQGKRKQQRTATDEAALMYGKVPPQAKELEYAVLGAIMLEKTAFDTVSEILKAECFYIDAHQAIYKACSRLADKFSPIDLLTVVEELMSTGELDIVGGPYYITKLTNSVVSSANIETHARILLQKFTSRELIRISGEIIAAAYEDSTDVFDLVDEADRQITETAGGLTRRKTRSLKSMVASVTNRVDMLRAKPDNITGVPTGFKQVDQVTNGWQNADLIIIAARPSVGKTLFVLMLARNATNDYNKPTPVAFFSLEMTGDQLIQRLIACEGFISLQKVVNATFDDAEYEHFFAIKERVRKMPFTLTILRRCLFSSCEAVHVNWFPKIKSVLSSLIICSL